jgi:iron complex outermembrane receptor protein
MRNNYRLLILTILLTPVLTLSAQEVIDTIYVQAMKVPLKLRETGRSITVLEYRDIAAIPASSLDEVLATVPGIEVQSRNGFGAQGDILIRGSTFTQVLVLVDGMRLNDPLTAHFNGYIPVTPAEIDRIEILRGAASAMYGADAVGGVINIVTKTFGEPENGTSLHGEMNYGAHQLVGGHLGFSNRTGNWTIGSGFSQLRSIGEYIPARSIPTGDTLEAYRNDFDIRTLGASFGYRFNPEWNIVARTSFDLRNFSARYFYTTSPLDKSRETIRNWWHSMRLEKRDDRQVTSLQTAYKLNTDQFVFNPAFPSTNNHITRFLDVRLEHFQKLNDRVQFKTGAQADRRSIQSNDRGNHSDWHLGGFGTGVYRNDQLSVTFSIRGDFDQNYGFELSPQLNLSLSWNPFTFRTSGGRNIRAADYTERFVSNNLRELTPGRNLGNPDLEAERGWSAELGVDHLSGHGLQWQVTGFTRISNNLIDYVLTNEKEIGTLSTVGSLQENADYYFARNIAHIRTSGIEIVSSISHSFSGSDRMNAQLGYTFLHTSGEEDIVSVYLSGHARHLINTSLQFSWERFHISLNGLYKNRSPRIAPLIGRELTANYTVWNLRTSFQLGPIVSLQFQVNNLFDLEYQNILGAPMPRRWIMGGVRFGLAG